MKRFILFYDVVHDSYVERRRNPAKGISSWLRTQRVVATSGTAEPMQTQWMARLSCSGVRTTAVRSFAESDLYVRNGLVRNRWIREWTAVVGADYPGRQDHLVAVDLANGRSSAPVHTRVSAPESPPWLPKAELR